MLEKLQESIDKEQKETSSSKTVVEVLLQRMVSVDELLRRVIFPLTHQRKKKCCSNQRNENHILKKVPLAKWQIIHVRRVRGDAAIPYCIMTYLRTLSNIIILSAVFLVGHNYYGNGQCEYSVFNNISAFYIKNMTIPFVGSIPMTVSVMQQR
jgi:hypothetical protein